MIDHSTALEPVADPTRPPRIRVSHAERAATVTRLQHALVEGRLDLAETDERVTAAFAARYDSDLQLLVSDLPPQIPVPDEAPVWSALWESAVWRARTVVLGADAVAHTRPTPQQCRFAAALAGLAVMWMLVCAVVGAAIVA
jgi:Domain of unknown function (DUF1707)